MVQLRQDNKLGTLYNMVGFQTKLKYAEQSGSSAPSRPPECRVRAARRPAPQHLPQQPARAGPEAALKAEPRLRFAGQITGVEGYVESAAMGLIAGRLAAAERLSRDFTAPPPTTAHGALINHITGGHIETTDARGSSFQPMNVNFGLFPPHREVKVVDGKRLKHAEQAVARKRAYTARALADFDAWLSGATALAAE